MSQPLELESLTVRWSLPDPPVDAVRWKEWQADRTLPEAPLDRRLGWPPGTLSVLAQAFQEGLSRNVGWDLRALAEPAPYIQAAQVFRRGVAYRPASPLPSRTGEYPLHLKQTWDWETMVPAHSLVIMDEQLAQAWHLAKPEILCVDLTELSKNLESVAQILEAARIRSQQLGVHGPWTIIGGGVLADTAAFAAALAGKEFRLVPTTLLAMLDACVGGKTGVNYPPFGKNQLGLFAFPSEVLISTAWLRTLPKRAYRAGLSEAFKHALLLGNRALAAAITRLEDHPEELALSLRTLVKVKADIVAQDPSEKGLRASLNLGHTLAHALERISHERQPSHALLHGEAVAIGLAFCLDLSHDLGLLPTSIHRDMLTLLAGASIMPQPQELCERLGYDDLLDPELWTELLIGIRQDKKIREPTQTEWVLLTDWGQVYQSDGRYTATVHEDQIRASYRRWIERWTLTAQHE